tara:strand:- start:1228 stop:1899 length:672 start_codon:yes stop_codon:yes gene_type:complete
MSKDVPEADVASIRRQLARKPKFKRSMMSGAIADFEKIKAKMISEFNNHKVTREIEDGPDAENASGSLNKGNLFSFIGFVQGDTPTDKIREVLRTMFIISEVRVVSRTSRVWFNLPDRKEILSSIWDKTHLSWAPGRSWADGIETGLSGLGQYIYSPTGFRNPEISLSGTGLQAKQQLKSTKGKGNFAGSFKPKKYMREIVENAGKELWKLRMKQYPGSGTIT